MGSLALRPALLLFGNSRPRVTTTPLPHATGAYGQLPGRDFNPLDLLLLLRTDRPRFPLIATVNCEKQPKTVVCPQWSVEHLVHPGVSYAAADLPAADQASAAAGLPEAGQAPAAVDLPTASSGLVAVESAAAGHAPAAADY